VRQYPDSRPAHPDWTQLLNPRKSNVFTDSRPEPKKHVDGYFGARTLVDDGHWQGTLASRIVRPEGHMKSKLIGLFMLATAATPALCHSKPVQDCKVTFVVVYLDRLNNTNNGVPKETLKDVEKKLSAYGDVCYTGDKKSDLLFFIHTRRRCITGHKSIPIILRQLLQ
jgi:hypothetical protein